MNNINPFFLTDGYKTGHHLMYPEGTGYVYCNFTPRSGKWAPNGITKVVSFGQQFLVQYLTDLFTQGFFTKSVSTVLNEIYTEYSKYLGAEYNVDHIRHLHDLQYLPIQIKALPEGTLVPFGVPLLTIVNTRPEFYWLPNFLETLISNLLWKPITSATIAFEYRKQLTKWALATDKENVGFVDFQGHDFSMRGMDSPLAAMTSGLGHATSFKGSDTLTTIYGARKYYNTPEDVVVMSVPATEHSVMCAGSKDNEIETFHRLIKKFPKGILSVVSDTWDLWKVLTEYLPKLKDDIMARDGKLVIRPDSGDPVDIICGTRTNISELKTLNNLAISANHTGKGVIELLWDVFGGTTNSQGYKVLDPHIGAIYGDSITLERQEAICQRLEAKGFASTNLVFGIGSFTYQHNTRDTFGFAMKATHCIINDKSVEIFKDPVTGDGTKKSAKGLLHVYTENGEYRLKDQCTVAEEKKGDLQLILKDHGYINRTSLGEIRALLQEQL